MHPSQWGLSVLAFVALSCGCSREPAAVKNAYELMAKRLCREAIAPLKVALAEHPDDARIPKALCEASICFASQGGKEPDLPPTPELRNYCEQGFANAATAGDVVSKALVLSVVADRHDGNGAGAALAEAGRKSTDDLILWHAAYSLDLGRHWPSKAGATKDSRPGVRVTAASLGPVVAEVPSCLVPPEKASYAVVRRGGAKVLLPGTATVDTELKPGESIAVKSATTERVRFVDGVREHWKPATGWILRRSENNVFNGAFRPSPGMPSEVPLRPSYVMRSIPGIVQWDGLGDDRADCRSYSNHYVACLGARIDMRPGSLKYQSRTEERTTTLSYGAPGQNTARALYQAVAFEERETPEREVAVGSVYLLGDQCRFGRLDELLTDYTEWDAEVIETVLKGEIRKGLPALFLSSLGFEPKEIIFDRAGFALVWHESDGKNRELVVRSGRVDAVK